MAWQGISGGGTHSFGYAWGRSLLYFTYADIRSFERCVGLEEGERLLGESEEWLLARVVREVSAS